MSHKKYPVIVKCPTCGNEYILGVNGVDAGCDACHGIQRDGNGYAWWPGDESMLLLDLETGGERTVTRTEAFGEVTR